MENKIYRCEDGRLYTGNGRHRKLYWSPALISDFKRLYPTTPDKELADIYCVGVTYIRRKGVELGLRKDRAYIKELVKHRLFLANIELRRLGYPGRVKPGEVRNPFGKGGFLKGYTMSEEVKKKIISKRAEYISNHREQVIEHCRHMVACRQRKS